MMGNENWYRQEMEVPARSKNSWIRNEAEKIGVCGQQVEYLEMRLFCRWYSLSSYA